MKRYLLVYSLLLKLNLSSLLAYRANLINSAIATIGWGIVSIITMYLLTFRTSSVYGWSPQELILASGVYSILIGVFHMFFSRNFEQFSRTIHLGQLDSILLKPLDTQFTMSMWTFRFTNGFRILFGVIFVGFMMHITHLSLSFMQTILFIILFCSSLMLLYAIWFIVSTITVWFTNLSNVIDFLYTVSNLGRYPPEMIEHTKNIFIYIFLPLSLIATVPTKILLQKLSITEGLILFFCATILFYISRKFWQFALRFYTSASG